MKERRAQLHPRLALWLENRAGNLVFGKGRMVILEAIDAHGTLSAAATALGMSYRGLWGRIRHSEERLGYALIEAHVGRGPSSGTTLTPEGRALLQSYREFLARVTTASDEAFREFFGAAAEPTPRGGGEDPA
jgi:molybdate transport system regulatory protein